MSSIVRFRVGLQGAFVLAAIVGGVSQQAARADLLSRVDLPKVSEEAPLDLGTLPAADAAKCVITVLGVNAQSMYSQRPPYRCDKVGDAWRLFADRSPGTPIATLKFNGEHLLFSWERGVAKQAASGLRNCVLQVTIPENNPDPNNFNQGNINQNNVKSIALRAPAQASGPVIELKQATDISNPDVEDLPESDNLVLEVFGLSGYERPMTFNPENKRSNLKQPLQIILKPMVSPSPGMRLDVTLTKLGSSLAVEVRPIVIMGDMSSTTHSLTMKVLTDAQNKTRILLSGASVKLKNDEKLLTSLEAKLAQMNTPTNRTVKQKNAFDQQVSKLQGQMQNDKQKIDQLRRQVTTYQAQLDALPELMKIATEIDGKAALEFRVLYPVDKHQIVLFATEKAPTDPPPPAQY